MPSRVRESNTLFASRLKPTVPSNTMDHPSFTFFNCQRILAALELGSEAQLLLNSTQIKWDLSWHFGGPDRVRTDDLLDANQALSQLSYGPKRPIIGHLGAFAKTFGTAGAALKAG